MQMNFRWKTIASAILFAVCTLIGARANALVLTAGGISEGFTLTKFADGFPTTGYCCGPLGIGFTSTGGVMVADYAGRIAVFATNTDGQHNADAAISTTDYGMFSPVGIAQVGGAFYLARQNLGRIDEIDANGNFVRVVATGIGSATGMTANPYTGNLCVSGNGGVFEVNPATGSVTLKVSVSFVDGLTLSQDGSTLYGEYAGLILGWNTTTFATVFNSGGIPNGPDGVAIGSGSLAGKLFINTNNGVLYEQDIVTHALTEIANLGSRGDFVYVDPNGSLLITQTDSIWRLTAPSGAAFETTVPEPSSLALLGLGLFGFGFSRRRRA